MTTSVLFGELPINDNVSIGHLYRDIWYLDVANAEQATAMRDTRSLIRKEKRLKRSDKLEIGYGTHDDVDRKRKDSNDQTKTPTQWRIGELEGAPRKASTCANIGWDSSVRMASARTQ